MILEWIVYGVFALAPGGQLDNPITNNVGLIGEHSLPYVVPQGYNLIISDMGIEGPGPSSAEGNQVGMALWLGDLPCTNDKSIMSCTTAGGSTQLTDLNFIIPEGHKVNLHTMNNTPYGWANGFYVQGFLVPNN